MIIIEIAKGTDNQKTMLWILTSPEERIVINFLINPNFDKENDL